jgi:hypothetical protein
MSNILKDIDPRGLIYESYRIDGITEGECRSIFLDWALFEDHEMPQKERIEKLFTHYSAFNDAHPMSAVLHLALQDSPTPKRRGGRRGRVT